MFWERGANCGANAVQIAGAAGIVVYYAAKGGRDNDGDERVSRTECAAKSRARPFMLSNLGGVSQSGCQWDGGCLERVSHDG